MIDRRSAALLLALTTALGAHAQAQTVPPPDDAGPILGMYTTSTTGPDTDVAIHASHVPTTVTVHIVLSNPGIESLSAAMFRIERSDELAAASFFGNVTNGHPTWETWDFPDIVWLIGLPRPVVDDQVWLLRFELRIVTPVSAGYLYLVPHTLAPGVMEFVGPDDTVARTMLPNSQDLAFTSPVFHVTAGTVSAATRTLSEVKTLFR